ncbi:hypothetical protein CEE37_10800 [candidate division LCP-89 bacterium B3_LCP]|uniref:Bulb-type lectin domain-containing protein n=1 Tax=candidate division LCP-89 bacterium B3_LCP TaxID=2012998 RepID=A0A532UXT4_UNCL8|nr:MAG: hypothetical protein CEE37_10800 [candidate division LCP-89 bacterium B3_LCP]
MKTKFNKIQLITTAVVALHLIAGFAWSQDEVDIWSIWGTGFEGCYSFEKTSCGGYILGGRTDSSGEGQEDVFIVKVNSEGEIGWQRTFGGSGSDFCESVSQTFDGGFIAAGWSNSFGSDGYDMYLLKTDSEGSLEWQKTFGDKFGDYCYSVQQTTDGGYILGGATNGSNTEPAYMYLVKTDERGNLEWEKTYGGGENDGCYSVRQTSDGGYILAGDTRSFSDDQHDYDMYLVKTDARGNLAWQKTYGGASCDGCYDVEQTADGGYILAGDTESADTNSLDIYLVKTDADGQLQWENSIGGTGWDDCHSVFQTVDNGYVVAGYSDSFGAGDYDFFIAKTDHNGELEWQKTMGGSENDYAYSVQQIDENEYVIAGYSESMTGSKDDIKLVHITAFSARFTQARNF